MTVKTVAAVTVARSDYGILRPVLRAIDAAPELRLQLIVAGTHGSAAQAPTRSEIDRDGFAIAEQVDTLPRSDTPLGIAQAIVPRSIVLQRRYASAGPDLVLLAGDRFETLAAASAALPFTIPIAHLHEGELTEGAIDEQIRHAITKLSHLHFVCTRGHAARVVSMGEAPWRVTVSDSVARRSRGSHSLAAGKTRRVHRPRARRPAAARDLSSGHARVPASRRNRSTS